MAHLEFDGFAGQYADIADIGAMSQEQLEDIQKLSADGGEEGARAFLAAVITEWHIINPKTQAPLPPVSSSEWTAKQIPLRIVRDIAGAIQEAVAALIPKGS